MGMFREKIKVLLSDTAPLYPPLWGGPKRIWNIFGNFSEQLFSFTYVGVRAGIEQYPKYCFYKIRHDFKEIDCSLPAHYSFWHIFERVFFKNTSLDLFVYLYMNTDWHFRYVLNSQKANVLICSHPWSALSLKKSSDQFFVYDAHNCEYLLMHQILGNHLLKGPVLARVKYIEGQACKKSDLITVCSERERDDLINLYNLDPQKLVIVPNGANPAKDNGAVSREQAREKFLLKPQDKAVVFIGAYYKPNIVAARFIVDKLARELKGFRFLIAGTVSDAFKKVDVPKNVDFLGRLLEEELDALLRASDIAVNPMFEGSGVNIKMLDYMAYGLPIVTTDCGARGIDIKEKSPMVISSPDKFAFNIQRIIADEQMYKEISSYGKEIVASRYDWRIISKSFQDTLLERLNA